MLPVCLLNNFKVLQQSSVTFLLSDHGIDSWSQEMATFQLPNEIFLFIFHQVWSTAQDQISNVHPRSERINLSGTAQSALLEHSATIVKVIKRHVDKWQQKHVKTKTY